MRRDEVAGSVAAEVAANVGRFSGALRGGDGAGAASVYLDDALLLPPTGDVITGIDAIERFWRSGIEIGLHAVELEPLGREGAEAVLFEHGRYRMVFALVDGRSRVERGPYVMVHARTIVDGSWRWAVNAFGSPS